jgi:ligand-binding sensor domain-containing protein
MKVKKYLQVLSICIACIVAVTGLAGCKTATVSSTAAANSSIYNKSDWAAYTDGNTVGQVLVKGNGLWAATEGGAVEWNIATGAYQKFTTMDGLISNYITGAAQDKDGNLWFVTIEGVTEYNGKTWQNFPNTDINSAISIGVASIAFDSKNKLYLGMSDGSIYLFNGKYQQIKIPDQTPPGPAPAIRAITALAVDKNNSLWSVNWQGIQRYNGKSWVDSQDIPGFPQGTISFIGTDKNDDLWFQDTSDFATTYLYRYDGKTWQKIEMSPTGSEAQSITIDDKGNVWCACLNTLYCYNGKTWQNYSCPVRDIGSIAADDKGNIWCGANSDGVLRFDGSSWKTYLTDDTKGIDEQTFMAADNDGNIWFDSGNGLSRFDGKNWKIINPDIFGVTSFAQDAQGNVWCWSGGTLYFYDGTSWNTVTLPFGVFGSFNSVLEDNTDGIWVSTDTIVARYDGKSWNTFNIGDIFGVPPLTSLINSIAVDNQNTIWVATEDGILHFDGANWKIYTTADGLTDNDIAGLYQDKSGNIWAYGYGNGLYLFNGTAWLSFLPDDHIFDVAQDQNGNVWLATDHGVVKYNGNTFQSYTTADGIPGNSIHAIVVDNHNDIWCGTSYGVGYYDGKTWQSFSTIDGLAGDLVVQIVNEKSGDIWFSCPFGGLSRYAPAN